MGLLRLVRTSAEGPEPRFLRGVSGIGGTQKQGGRLEFSHGMAVVGSSTGCHVGFPAPVTPDGPPSTDRAHQSIPRG